jgi:hypothetical protein
MLLAEEALDVVAVELVASGGILSANEVAVAVLVVEATMTVLIPSSATTRRHEESVRR